MNLLEKAYEQLYKKKVPYVVEVNYSRRFSAYNANIKKTRNKIEVNLSQKWKEIDPDIQIGLMQILLKKLLKKKTAKTVNEQLYHLFIKNLHLSTPKTNIDPLLKDSFLRVNEKYFDGLMELTNIEWGGKTTTRLGLYNYHTDTITISSIFKEIIMSQPELIDYIMYHEMLHKKHKFKAQKTKAYYHTPAFKKDEKKFEQYGQIEKKLEQFLTRTRRKRFI